VSRKLTAEFFGTCWLVLGGCGSAVLAAKFPQVGIGLLGVALAFGLTVVTMAYAIGHISGCHLNPAVTLGLVSAGRVRAAEAPGYIVAQVLGAAAGAGVLWLIASGGPGFSLEGGFAANGYGAHSPGGYGLVSACLTLVHLISIPITNTSVNPARSTSQALFVGGWAMAQLWLFWVAPIAGAVLAGRVHAWLGAEDSLADREAAVRAAMAIAPEEALAPATAREPR